MSKELNFEDISDNLDLLPVFQISDYKDESVDYFDNGNIRIIVTEGESEGDLTSRKIQLYISKNGIHAEIVDIIIHFETGVETNKSESKSIKCYDGITRDIYYADKYKMLSSEFDALIARFSYEEVAIKVQNHIGRILFLLTLISLGDNEDDKSLASICSEYNLYKFTKVFKCKIKDLGKKIIGKYKGQDISIETLVSPIKDYAILKNYGRFKAIFESSSL